MEVIIAHRDKSYVEYLKTFLFKNGISEIYVSNNGFDALTYIIKNRSNIIVIEETLPGLNLNDIKKALIYKRIKPLLIISVLKKEPPKSILAKIKSEFTLDTI